MSTTLYESDFLTLDLNISNGRVSQASNKTSNSSTSEDLSKQLAAAGIPADIVAKLVTFGEPIKKLFSILGFTDKNPILGFIKQEFVQKELISSNLLTASTFKAIYAAVAKKLIADSEFMKNNDYNLLYCKKLYEKQAKEIEGYFLIQSKILRANASKYTYSDLIKNKKVFLNISSISDTDIKTRIKAIGNFGKGSTDSAVMQKLPKITDAELNSLGLAKAIYDSLKVNSDMSSNPRTNIQDTIVNNISNSRGHVSLPHAFAVMMSLSLGSNSMRAKDALSNKHFTNLPSKVVAEASAEIIAKKILPSNALSTAEADSLTDKIMSRIGEFN